ISTGGRFGSVLATVGDLDHDGYVDLAVGAPLEDGGRGAVYLYRGGTGGLGAAPPQRIAASDVHSTLRGFGGALTGGVDVDDNGYGDLAVGSTFSDHVVVMRSRAVVTVITSMTSSPPALTTDEQIFNVAVCVQCTGYNLRS
ncbi:FG-GAP repeat, partial [Trinorchestia longiramus]